MKRIATVFCLIVLVLQIHVPASAGASAAPSPREGGTMVYDTAHTEIVLFGGSGIAGPLNDTWTFRTPGTSGVKWHRVSPRTSPPARRFASMAYDAARKRVVLFGGLGASGPLGDTWTWDGQNWEQRSSLVTPAARYGASMAYDEVRHNVVLFGGKAVITPGIESDVNDTWIWDGSTWTPLATPSPLPRHFAAMAFDPRSQSTLLFGGAGGDDEFFGDTWLFNGVAWVLQTGGFNAPLPRALSGMALRLVNSPDPGFTFLLLFGGLTDVDGDGTPERQADTWVWDGSTWTMKFPDFSPPARSTHAMASYPPSGTVIVFGGSDSSGLLGDTWGHAGLSWTQL